MREGEEYIPFILRTFLREGIRNRRTVSRERITTVTCTSFIAMHEQQMKRPFGAELTV